MASSITIDGPPASRFTGKSMRRGGGGILGGRFVAGDRLPSSRDLAATLGVSRSTVTHAYEQLIAEGTCRRCTAPEPSYAESCGAVAASPGCGRAPSAARRVALSRYAKGLIEDDPVEGARPGHICFSQWGPDPQRFPWSLWRRLLSRQLRHVSRDAFDYAQQVQGYEPLRREIAGYVGGPAP